MATGTTDVFLDALDHRIDEHKRKFHQEVEDFSKHVKGTMRTVPRLVAIEYFELAVFFMTQSVPNLREAVAASGVTYQKEIARLGEDMKKLIGVQQKLDQSQKENEKCMKKHWQHLCDLETKSKRVENDVNKLKKANKSITKLEESQKKHWQHLGDLETKANTVENDVKKLKKANKSISKLEESQKKHWQHLGDLETKANRVENDVKKLKKANTSITKHIWGLRKLQQLLKSKTQSSQGAGATAAPSTVRVSTSAAATAAPSTSLASPSAGASPRGPPKSLTQRTTFSVGVATDAQTPSICDAKLLPGGLVVLADRWNSCVKVFTTLGKHLHSESLASWPARLAVMNTTPAQSFDVAVSLPNTSQIALLQVSQHGSSLKRYISTPRECWSIAAVDGNTLAVGYSGGRGIDLIDLSGRVLHQMSSDVHAVSMVASTDHLMVTTSYNSIAKINLKNRSTVFNHKVQQLRYPNGITCTPDGSSIVTDFYTRTLHLITPDGSWGKQLWAHPGGLNFGDSLYCVCVLDNVCLCSTYKGSVFVLDVSF